MAEQEIAAATPIAPFVWTETCTIQDLRRFKRKFENYCGFLNINLHMANNANRDERALAQRRGKQLLNIYGGDWIGDKIEAMPDNATATCNEVFAMLEAQFVDDNPNFHIMQFLSCKPNHDEKILEYITRLRVLAIQANMNQDEEIKRRIMTNHQETKYREKAMENITLAAFLAWATLKERQAAASAEHEATTSANRITRPWREQRGQLGQPKGGRLDCIKCGSKNYHDEFGSCPASKPGKKCNNCNAYGHFARMCDVNQQITKQGYQANNQYQFRRDGNGTMRQASREKGGYGNYKRSNRKVRQVKLDESAISETEVFEVEADTGVRATNRVTMESVQKAIHQVKKRTSSVKLKIIVKGVGLVFVLDTGAEVNLIGLSKYRSLDTKQPLKHPNCKILDYSKQSVDIIGCFTTKLNINGHCKPIDLIVVDDSTHEVDNLMGIESLTDYDLIRFNFPKVNSINKARDKFDPIKYDELDALLRKLYPSVYENRTGLMPNVQVKIKTNPDIEYTQQVPYVMPFVLFDGTIAKIKDMIDQGIIEEIPAGSPVTWISPIHPVEKHNYDLSKKDGIKGHKRMCQKEMRKVDKKFIRITANNKCLNKAIVKQKRPMPNIVQLRQELNGMKYFSKIDIKDAFNTLELDEESRALTTFSTPWGKLYRYRRLNMGLCIASEIYQEIMSSKLADLKNCKSALDDILVYGKTIAEHDEAMHALMKRIVELNLTINHKSEFRKTKITFFGLEISEDGITPNGEKLEDFMQAQAPHDKATLRSFLGLAGYFSDRIIKLSTLCEPLRKLVNSKEPFEWLPIHEQSFTQVKQALFKDCLGHFTVDDETELWVDAGPNGVAGFLVQKRKNGKRELISCCSKTFSQSEKNYSQVEKEGYASVWAIEHFHVYLYGQKFKLMTDNKSMVHILQNENSKRRTPIRLQHWRSRLTQYRHMQPTFVKGTSNIADYLSRCLKENKYVPSEDLNVNVYRLNKETEKYVNELTTSSDFSMNEIIQATTTDKQLQLLKNQIKHRSVENIDHRIDKAYRSIIDRLSIAENGVLLMDDKIVIPEALKERVITRAHEGHLGIKLTKSLLRNRYFFPLMDKLINEQMESCIGCQANHKKNLKHEPFIASEIPDGPRKLMAIDFSSKTPSGEYILVIICEYSRYPILKFTKGLTSRQAINALKQVFKIYGVPEVIKSDNGPAFASNEFRNFSIKFNFKHRKITAEHPESNPICERFMANINKSIRVAQVTGQNWKINLQRFLRDYKAAPHSTTGFSPNELFGINDNEVWPSLRKQLTTDQLKAQVKLNDTAQKSIIKRYADQYQNTKMSNLKENDTVMHDWKRTNKHQPLLDPNPYKITKINGNMITAKRSNHQLVRNSIRFKKVKSSFYQDAILTKNKRIKISGPNPPTLPSNLFLNEQPIQHQPDTPPQTPGVALNTTPAHERMPLVMVPIQNNIPNAIGNTRKRRGRPPNQPPANRRRTMQPIIYQPQTRYNLRQRQ